MKKKIFPLFLTPALLLSGFLRAQDMDSTVVRQKIEGKEYRFIAQRASPMRGRSIELSSLYDLRVSGDSVIAALPYYGRAYAAPIDPSNIGISFSSIIADYQSAYRKKRWEISIRPKDAISADEMTLTVYPNGRASLQVNSHSRQPISFNGYLSPE